MMKSIYLLMHPFYLLIFTSFSSHLYNSINLVDAFAISSRGISEFADMMLLGNTSLHYENKAASQLTDICNETECNISGNILLSNGLNLPSFEDIISPPNSDAREVDLQQEHPETLKMMAKLLNDSAMVTNEGKRVFRALKSRNSATKIFDRNIPVASTGAITALHVVVSSLAFVVAFLLV
uniref:NR LBD domain-containing protein n=1 Tax=Parascaris univalens TaxID=6257 RepID=A0A915CJB2_PARUN